jgi:hypothetical protein
MDAPNSHCDAAPSASPAFLTSTRAVIGSPTDPCIGAHLPPDSGADIIEFPLFMENAPASNEGHFAKPVHTHHMMAALAWETAHDNHSRWRDGAGTGGPIID